MRLSKSQLAVLALIIANMIWGAGPPIFKLTLHQVHPFTLAFLRFGVAAILIYPFARGKLRIKPKDYFSIFLIGLFGISINIVFFFYGLAFAPSINAAIIGSAGPIFIILFSLFFLREKPSKKLIIGSHLGLLGVLIILLTPLFRSGGNLTSLGNIFLLISAFGSVIDIIITRRIMKKYSAASITFWSFLIGSLTLLPFFVNEVHDYGFLQHISMPSILGILFGILFSSLAAYYLQNWALKYLTASDVSVFAYIDPVATIVIAAPLLGEFPDSVFILGALFVFGGILLAEGRFHWHPFHLFFEK